jgi:hypothetical protein
MQHALFRRITDVISAQLSQPRRRAEPHCPAANSAQPLMDLRYSQESLAAVQLVNSWSGDRW